MYTALWRSYFPASARLKAELIPGLAVERRTDVLSLCRVAGLSVPQGQSRNFRCRNVLGRKRRPAIAQRRLGR